MILTSPGYWVAPADASSVRLTLIGAGGGGGVTVNSPPFVQDTEQITNVTPGWTVAGAPGGSGGIAQQWIPISGGASYSVTIGVGGRAQTISTGTNYPDINGNPVFYPATTGVPGLPGTPSVWSGPGSPTVTASGGTAANGANMGTPGSSIPATQGLLQQKAFSYGSSGGSDGAGLPGAALIEWI